MPDEEEKSGSIDLARPEEEALGLRNLAEEKYNSGDLNSAVTFANRARDLSPSISGLSEMLTAFEILLAASVPLLDSTNENQKPTPDYYRILQVQRFSHINSIKKQYKKLALTLHPDKNPSVASEEAFKLVGEAARVLSDKIRRKEYDTRLRIAMQSEAAQAVVLEPEEDGEAFSTACSSCRLVHQFERKYLGHNLMCPSCKKTFKAIEVKEARKDEGNVGGVEKNEGVEGGQTRVSARLQERVAKGGYVGIVEKFGLGVKRRNSSAGEVSEKSGKKVARSSGVDCIKSKRAEMVEKSGEVDDDSVENCRFKRMENLVNVNGDGRVGGGVEEALESGEDEIVENERSDAAGAGEDESMTLSQMQMMVKKKKKNKNKEEKKLVDGKLTSKVKEVNSDKFKVNEREKEIERGHEKANVGEGEGVEEIENVTEEEIAKEREENGEKEKTVNLRKSNRRRVPNVRNLEAFDTTSKSHIHSEIENNGSSEQGNSLVEKEKEKETGVTREKRGRRKVSKYGNSDIEMLIAREKGEVEILPVEDSQFHDFDKDRRQRSFKKGQVWAAYDDDGGMPRHYALVTEIVSVNPFEVTLSWLKLQSNGDEELEQWLEKGFHVSCGIFQATEKVKIRYLNLFSHLVECERAARELYRIYPRKGSVWAVYSDSGESEEGDQRSDDKRSYNVVVCLTSYSDIHGLSIAFLERVSGFKTVYKRREIGAKAVVCLGASEIKIFSHQIPAKKLSGEESSDSGLPKDCWELDPASLTPQLLAES